MADVNVEFGAKDTGLEATLKTVQEQMTKLESEVKSGTLSFEDLAKKMRELQQAERMAEKFSQLGGQVKQSGEEAKQTEQKISALSEILGQTATSAMSLDARIASVQMKLAELRDKTTSADLSMEELEDTLRKISTLESAERRLKGIGDASQESKPKVDSLGDATKTASDKADGAAGLFDASFQKIAGAFTVGNLAAMGFEKAIDLAFSAARAVIDSFGQALDLGGRLNDLSARTGETAGKLLVLEQAFKDSGLSADQVGVAINKLQNFMAEAQAGGEAQAQAMQRLGISMADLAGKTPTQQMQVFAQAISAIEDPTQRAAIAGDVFGEKLGGRLLPLLTQFSPALDDAGTKVGSLADVMDENAAIFDQTGETIEAVQGKLAAFAAGILGETIPAIQGMGTAMEEVDAAGFGEKIGEMIAPSLRSVTAQIDLLNQGLGFLGQKLKEISGIGSESSQEFDFMGLKFGEVAGIIGQALPSQLLPLKLALQGIGEQSRESTVAQGEAAAAIEQTGNKAAEAAPKIQGLSQGANDLPVAFESTLPLVGEFNAQLDQSAPAIEGIKNQSGLIKDDFSEIVTFSAQLPGEFDAQTQSIGGVTDQLELQKELYGLIAPKVEEVKEDIAKTEKNITGATIEIKKFKSVMDIVAESKMDAPAKTFAERLDEAQSRLSAMKGFIGEDMNNMSLQSIITKLGIDAPGLEDSSKKLKRVETAIDVLGKADPADITPKVDPDKPKNKIEAVKKFLDGIKGIDATPKINQNKAQDAIKGIEKQINDLGNKDIDLKIQPKINKEALKQEVDLALQSSKGTEILTKINEAVFALKELVAKIEVKLPQQALAY